MEQKNSANSALTDFALFFVESKESWKNYGI